MLKPIAFIFHLFLVSLSAVSQAPSFNFRHLTTSDGLTDGMVRAIVQDKYGFIWIGTSYGLNRFDGISMKTFFFEPGDSNSLPDNYVQSLYCDAKGNLWAGTMKGLSEYDYAANRFINYARPKDIAVGDIHADKKENMWLATEDGLWRVDEQKKSIYKFTRNGDTAFQKIFSGLIYQIIASPEGELYFATGNGIKILNPVSLDYGEIRHDSSHNSISSDIIYSIAFDTKGQLWASTIYPKSLLNKIDLHNHSVKLYDRFIDKEKNRAGNQIQRIMMDKKGRLWVTSSLLGLSLYNEEQDDFHDYKSDPLLPNSILDNHNITIYQDGNGIIWMGSAGYGLSYFHPDNNLFYTLHPAEDKRNSIPDVWCRSSCEDKKGNLWFATGKGLAKYNRQSESYTQYINEEGKKPVLYTNSVRSLLADDDGDIWIGTAKGLNRYRSATGTIDFFDEKQGVPLTFFWMMTKTENGDVWLGASRGLFHYIKKENRFDDLTKDPILSKYVHQNIQAIFTDSKNRLWIGMLHIGIAIYDPESKNIRLLTIKDSLISDTRFSSFAEDKNGIIWIGSEEGLTACDPVKNSSHFFTRATGLPSNRTNNLMVDPLNRIWVGTSNGLCVLNSNGKFIRRFDINDGLLTNQFNEQSAYCTRDGFFIYPTYKGFVMFRPENYKESNKTVPVYITSFKISEGGLKPAANTEDIHQLKLGYSQDFFSIELAGLNYMNPLQCTYAYKLEPFDKDWIFTRRREVNYTNVPAGQYTFHYKVMTDSPNRSVPEKTMVITISAVFYKTWWFRLLVLLVAGTSFFAFFRYRMNHRERILVLQNKAQLLEKEKTLVMYENLKQHLNPHFLFNSLTALSSLIRVDQHQAGDFLEKMSKVYRYILKNRDNETVPLSEELKFVALYIQLQKTRFEKGLQVNVNVGEEYEHRKIAPVTLQNLVENAIKHNVADTGSPLIIDLFTEDGYLVVRNNLQKKQFVETSNKQGLFNMESFYRYLSARPMIIAEDKNYFTVKIPLI